MPINKKQLVRLIRLVAQLKENRYPNCARFVADLRKADLFESLNLSCTEKTVFRDIQVLKEDFAAPVKFDRQRNGYYLAHHGWDFLWPKIFDDSEILAAVLGARVAGPLFSTLMKEQIRNAVDCLLTNNNPDFLDKAWLDSLEVIPSNRTKVNADVLMPLFNAWQNHQLCHIAYNDSQENTTERDVEPHASIFFEEIRYTKGFFHKRYEMRTLVVSRIKSIHLQNTLFKPKKNRKQPRRT